MREKNEISNPLHPEGALKEGLLISLLCRNQGKMQIPVFPCPIPV